MARRTIAELTITSLMDETGDRIVSVHAESPDGGVPDFYDLHAMLSVATDTINRPEWTEQYGDSST